MNKDEAREMMEKGMDYLEKGWAVDAIACFEEVLARYGRTASVISWLGLAMAMSKRGDLRPAESLCREAIEKEHYIPHYYLNLSRVYLVWGKKKEALSILKEGIRATKGDERLVNAVRAMGMRKKPPIPFLSRSHPINRYIGMIRHRLTIRQEQAAH